MFVFPIGLSWTLDAIQLSQAERSAAREEARRNLSVARAHEQAAITEMRLARRPELQQP